MDKILKERSSNNKAKIPGKSVLALSFTLLLIYSCNPTKYVPEGQTLLDKNHISVSREGIKKSDLQPYIRQKPNKKIFGTRFHLGLYNLSNINKEKWPHSWLRNIGEEPVIYDAGATVRSREQIRSYIASRGYFDSRVDDSTRVVKRKSEVYYNVDLKTPYTIRNLYYEFADTTIRKLFNFDSVNCLIERGKPYDVEVLQAERTRFERFIKDRGFYGFSSEHIYFRVDSAIGNRQVNIYYGIRNFLRLDDSGKPVYVPHSVYRIENIFIFPDFVPKEVLEGGESYLQSLDTLLYKNYYFVTPRKKSDLKYDLILQAIYLKPGFVYNVTNTEQTQNHLMALRTFRHVNIFFREEDAEKEGTDELALNCFIQLTLLDQQSYKIELEGTNTSGDIGGALNLVYQHKNLFRGAELFNLKLKGAYEAISQNDTVRKLKSTQEYGVETSLRFPKFLLPVLKAERFVKKYGPSTTVVAAYSYQKMPSYIRTMANASFGYNWNAGPYRTHIVNPLQLNLINLLWIDERFQAKIDTTSYLAYSYKDVMILGANYSFIFNNQKIQKSRDYWFLRVNAETSGNLLGLISSMSGIRKKDGSYNIFSQPFAQYVRADMDLRYNVILNEASSIVYRGFLGIGIPYGNSKALPFEKQYFGGGANGIRAWPARSLGPGSYLHQEKGFVNQTADIKLEANAEYRFKLFWILEGALFLDAGNIWTYNEDKSRPGSKFVFKYLLDDIAVGAGTGLRFDFKFVVGRLDMGMKLRDPSIRGGPGWIMANRKYNFRDDFTFVLGIGYPF